MLEQFLNFDKLIGTKLIKLLYYIGMAGIVLFSILSLFGGLAMMTRSFAGGLGTVLLAIIGCAISLVFWRFMCEIYMLFFRISDDLRDIRNDKLGAAPASVANDSGADI